MDGRFFEYQQKQLDKMQESTRRGIVKSCRTCRNNDATGGPYCQPGSICLIKCRRLSQWKPAHNVQGGKEIL